MIAITLGDQFGRFGPTARHSDTGSEFKVRCNTRTQNAWTRTQIGRKIGRKIDRCYTPQPEPAN